MVNEGDSQSDETKYKLPPVLYAETQACIAKLEEELQGPLLAYWNGPRGSVCHNDVVAFYELLERIGHQDVIYLFVKSDGGNGKASLRIINLIRQYTKRLIALLPLECASAATMLAIGADEIRMGPMAFLSAVDTALTHDLSPVDRDNDRVSVSLDELNRVIRRWRSEPQAGDQNPYQTLFQYVHPLVIGAVDRAESLSIMLCEELLSYHSTDPQRAQAIAETLNSKYPSHGYPILMDEAKQIGLKVSPLTKTTNDALLQLNRYYSEMGQRATTDFDDCRSHSNEILNILEVNGLKVYYQNDKDWFYRTEERRWITLNDNSSWRKIEMKDGQPTQDVLHIL